MAMKKVLIIAYYFPPLGGAGVQRISKFVKYLPEFGWEPVVLTVKPIDYPAYDETLLEEIPPGVKVYRGGSFDPQRLIHLLRKRENMPQKSQKVVSGIKAERLGFLKWLFIPDSKIGWLPLAILKGLNIVREQKVDLIFSSSPPATAHLVAYCLSKLSGKPLVVDFRDPWGVGQRGNQSKFHKKMNQWLQRKVFQRAGCAISVNKSMAESFQESYPDMRSAVITNGYDPSDFQGIENISLDKFEIVYSGTFNRWHDPRPFLEAFSELARENVEFAKSAHCTKVGLVLDWDWEELLKQFKLQGQVRSVGYVSHRESLQHLMRGRVLLLTTGGEAGSALVSTGKIYEYLAARKPILAVVPENGEAANLVRENRAGIVVDPKNKKGIQQALLSLFEKFRSGNLKLDNAGCDLTKYERKQLTQRLAEIFSECSNE